MFSAERVRGLPAGLDELAVHARHEGFVFLDRLIQGFELGENRFELPGEGLFAVSNGGVLLAVGGLNVDPYVKGEAVGRVRRVYIHPGYRRLRIGATLIATIERFARTTFAEVRLRTDTVGGARFYEQLGYFPVPKEPNFTHRKLLR